NDLDRRSLLVVQAVEDPSGIHPAILGRRSAGNCAESVPGVRRYFGWTVTQSRPPPSASPAGRLLSSIVSTIRTVRGLIRVSDLSPALATQTAPSSAATATGCLPTRIRATSSDGPGSILESDPASELATQTEPPPTARETGPRSTGTSRTIRLLAGSTSTTRLRASSASQSAPSPKTASEKPLLDARRNASEERRRGSIRNTP